MKRMNIVPQTCGNSLHFDYRHRIPVDLVSFLVEREVCNRIDGCPIVNNVCVDCITVQN